MKINANEIKKVLIIRLGAIGDIVHTSVIQQSIKQKYSDCEIHFLTSPQVEPLLRNDVNLEKIYEFDSSQKNNLFYLLKLGLMLRKEKFDVIICLQNSLRNKLILFIANPKKIVYRSKNRVHAMDAFFNSAKEIFNDIEKPANLKLYLDEKILTSLQEKTKNFKRPFIIINAGGENDKARQGRIWSISNWIELSNKLVKAYDGTVFIVGSVAEREKHKELLKIKSSILFSGKLTLEESAALFSLSDLFISGDSGPLHIASALGVKTLGLIGSTPVEACGPYGENCHSLAADYDGCVGCDKKTCQKLEEGIYTPCMQAITSDSVFEFINKHNLF